MDEATVVVALDFGTSFSGFAYAHHFDPERIFSHYNWPCQARAGAKPYCKTQTSLFYVPGGNGTSQLKDWGWSALLRFCESIKDLEIIGRSGDDDATANSSQISGVTTGNPYSSKMLLSGADTHGSPAHLLPQIVKDVVEVNGHDQNISSTGFYFATNSRLYLASDLSKQSVINGKLPSDLTEERLTVDYLSCISKFVTDELKTKYGAHFTKKAVQWCVTLPAVWTEEPKQFMKVCAQKAGLVEGPECCTDDASSHPLVIVLEPVAASVYCQQSLSDLQLKKGNRILIANVGGVTIDIVVHSKSSDDSESLQVDEERTSYGALGGGTFVDKHFLEWISRRIGCFRKFCAKNPSAALDIISWWEGIKRGFDGPGYSAVKEVPRKLGDAWEAHDREMGRPKLDDYSELRLQDADIKEIFDPEVNKVLEAMEQSMAGADVVVVVGGFAGSPYLQAAIRERFEGRVKEIIIPSDPGSAVSQGAVRETMNRMLARKEQVMGTPNATDQKVEKKVEESRRHMRCMNVFSCFVKRVNN